jgi:acetyl-CoA carboxylase biotin carboxylase subunit
MARALREYDVLGIKTTIPFFIWLMQRPEYREGRYDTTYLDRLLADRKGDSFNELSDEQERLAALAAALDTYLRAGSVRPDGDRTAPRSLWLQTARREALRG